MGFQIMFDQANSFYLCANLCRKESDSRPESAPLLSIPQIVNLAFACEVYLKTLLDFHKIGIGKKHKLNDLFDALPKDDQEFIDIQLRSTYPFPDVWGRRMIDVEANAFVEWRYGYEKSRISCDIGYLIALSKALQVLCCKRLYAITWEKYCKIARISSGLWG